jgi:hypothetical protein
MGKNYEDNIANWDIIYGNKRVPPEGSTSDVNLFAIGSLSDLSEIWESGSIEMSYNSQKNRADGIEEYKFAAMANAIDLELTYVSNNVYRTNITSARDLQSYPTLTMQAITVDLQNAIVGADLTYKATIKVAKKVYYGLPMDIIITHNSGNDTISFPKVLFIYEYSDENSSYMTATFKLIGVTTDHNVKIQLSYPTHPIHNPIIYDNTHTVTVYKKYGSIQDFGNCLFSGVGGQHTTKWEADIQFPEATTISSTTLESIEGYSSPSIVTNTISITGGELIFDVNLLPNISDTSRDFTIKMTIVTAIGDIFEVELIYKQDFINNLYPNIIPSIRAIETTTAEYMLPGLFVNDNDVTYYRMRYRTAEYPGGEFDSWQGGVETGDIMYEYSKIAPFPGIPVSAYTQYEIKVYIPIDEDGVIDNSEKTDSFEMDKFSSFTGTLSYGVTATIDTPGISVDFSSKGCRVGYNNYSYPEIGIKIFYYFNGDIHNTLTYVDYSGNSSGYLYLPVPERYLQGDTVEVFITLLTGGEDETPGELYTGSAIGIKLKAPSNLGGSYIDDDLSMSWDSVSGATDYEVKWGPEPGGYTAGETTVNTYYDVTWEYIDSDAYFVVRSMDNWAKSEWSAEKHLVHTTPAVPSVPSSISAELINGGADGARVSWGSSTDADGYKLYRAKGDSSGSYSLIETTSNRSYDDAGATAIHGDEYYYYKVTGYNDVGESDYRGPEEILIPDQS